MSDIEFGNTYNYNRYTLEKKYLLYLIEKMGKMNFVYMGLLFY